MSKKNEPIQEKMCGQCNHFNAKNVDITGFAKCHITKVYTYVENGCVECPFYDDSEVMLR